MSSHSYKARNIAKRMRARDLWREYAAFLPHVFGGVEITAHPHSQTAQTLQYIEDIHEFEEKAAVNLDDDGEHSTRYTFESDGSEPNARQLMYYINRNVDFNDADDLALYFSILNSEAAGEWRRAILPKLAFAIEFHPNWFAGGRSTNTLSLEELVANDFELLQSLEFYVGSADDFIDDIILANTEYIDIPTEYINFKKLGFYFNDRFQTTVPDGAPQYYEQVGQEYFENNLDSNLANLPSPNLGDYVNKDDWFSDLQDDDQAVVFDYTIVNAREDGEQIDEIIFYDQSIMPNHERARLS